MRDELTLDEKAALVAGRDTWSLPALPRVGLGEVRMTDGPVGARGDSLLVEGTPALCIPCGAALGATWNVGCSTTSGCRIK